MLNEKSRRRNLVNSIALKVFHEIFRGYFDSTFLDFIPFHVDYTDDINRFNSFTVYENGDVFDTINIGNNLYLGDVVLNYINKFTRGGKLIKTQYDIKNNKEATLKVFEIDKDNQRKIYKYNFIGLENKIREEDVIDVFLPNYSSDTYQKMLKEIFNSNFDLMVINDIAENLIHKIDLIENNDFIKIYLQITDRKFFYKLFEEWLNLLKERNNVKNVLEEEHKYCNIPYKFDPNGIEYKSYTEPKEEWNVYLYKYDTKFRTHKFFDWYHIEGSLDNAMNILNNKDCDCISVDHTKDLVKYHKLNTDNYIAMYDNHSVTDDIILVTKDKDSKYKELIEKGYKLYVVNRVSIDDSFRYSMIISKMKEAVKSNNTVTFDTKVTSIRYFTNNIENAIRGQMDNYLQIKFTRFDGSKNPFKHYSRYGFEKRQLDEKTYALTIYGDTCNCDSHVIYHYE